MKEIVNIVWFKRDLRVHDHAPLRAAADAGKVLPLYVVEPDYWALPDSSQRQWRFVVDSLIALHQALQQRGQGLLVKQGDMLAVLNELEQQFTIQGIYSHQESGNLWTFERDKQVLAWCRSQNIPWHESLPYGVFRRFYDRDGWADKWEAFMREPRVQAPKALPALSTELPPFSLPEINTAVLETTEAEHQQHGGRRVGIELLQSFVQERGLHYSREMSSPLSATHSCSRLSPHISFGTLSMREVHQKIQQFLQRDSLTKTWRRSLKSFDSRLHWHCHFIQKLETEPAFEIRNMLPVYDGLREDEFDEALFAAWQAGQTGFPFIDACMRSLRITGWLNFRMRAMLVSFASYQLWLHWQKPAWHLAQCFTDYEPGIHYCQIQMQSGTTGINALRMYNPVKQSQDQDPQGIFIRRWVTELRHVPNEFIHEPWKMSLTEQRKYGCELGKDYPEPIVDHMQAVRTARARISQHRKAHPEFFEQAKALFQKHGSRRKRSQRQVKQKPTTDTAQLDLFGRGGGVNKHGS
jgi:deoxyribodipyrimidine photo-lyase